MIRRLTLRDVGPARNLKFEFSPRLNVLTGDNGLGKSFVLDVLWWVLTTTWAGEKAFPFRPLTDEGEPSTGEHDPYEPGVQHLLDVSHGAPSIFAELFRREDANTGEGTVLLGGTFDVGTQDWERAPFRWIRKKEGNYGYNGNSEHRYRPECLVLYARVDGSYAVFDAHYVKGGVASFAEAAIVLSPSELWDGKEVADREVQGGKRTVIGGLVADWVSWQQRAKSPEFTALCEVLGALSSPDEPLVPSEPTRVHLRDRRDIPTLRTSYGVVPVTLASAGMKRALSLAYLLVWAWAEHEKAAKASRRPPTRDVVLLIDEPELHQHPAWQRVFLPAVLKAVGGLAPNAAVQVVTATHSPLVLASLEAHFDPTMDTLFGFDLMPRAHRVKVETLPWRARGDVSNWLTSDVFDLAYARSREAEVALKRAVKVLDQPELSDAEARAIHRQLHDALGDTDPFWARWLSYANAKGIEP